jgi:hypothetical protein
LPEVSAGSGGVRVIEEDGAGAGDVEVGPGGMVHEFGEEEGSGDGTSCSSTDILKRIGNFSD